MEVADCFERGFCVFTAEVDAGAAVQVRDFLDFVARVVGVGRVLVVADDVDVHVTEDFRLDNLADFVGRTVRALAIVCASVLVRHIYR